MAKQLEFNEDARRRLEAGVNKLANAVKVTLGQRVATWCSTRSSALPPSPTMVCRSLVKSSSKIRSRTWAHSSSKRSPPRPMTVAGDGTTTATVLGPGPRSRKVSATLRQAQTRWVIKRGIEAAVEVAVGRDRFKQSVQVDRLQGQRSHRSPAISAADHETSARFFADADRQGRQGRCCHRRGVQHLRHSNSSSPRACSSTRATSPRTS